jgi:hypothetical protein
MSAPKVANERPWSTTCRGRAPLLLEVDEPDEQGSHEEELKGPVGADGAHELTRPLAGPVRADALRQEEERCDPEGGRARRLDDEEQEERPLGQ